MGMTGRQIKATNTEDNDDDTQESPHSAPFSFAKYISREDSTQFGRHLTVGFRRVAEQRRLQPGVRRQLDRPDSYLSQYLPFRWSHPHPEVERLEQYLNVKKKGLVFGIVHIRLYSILNTRLIKLVQGTIVRPPKLINPGLTERTFCQSG